jgi:hypothetical protein
MENLIVALAEYGLVGILIGVLIYIFIKADNNHSKERIKWADTISNSNKQTVDMYKETTERYLVAQKETNSVISHLTDALNNMRR